MSAENQAEFRILGETEEFLAVDKPAGLLVHPTKPGGPRTLWDGLCALLGYELANGGQVSIINRLDRETSGVVLVAKSAAAAGRAGKAMQKGVFEKEYRALCFGWPSWDEETIDAPIRRKGEVEEASVWLERMIHPDGQPARTRFQVERRLETGRGRYALLRAFPQTGRTHQIRVHAAALGCPLLGDKLYARGRENYLSFIRDGWTAALQEKLWLPRHALHCSRMQMEGLAWTSGIPSDLAALLPPAT